MKGIFNLAAACLLVVSATTAVADDTTTTTTSTTTTPKTAMDANWICTTNASSSSVDAEKAADDKMANTAMSASDAFSFAATNCRDCTKITCEAQSKD